MRQEFSDSWGVALGMPTVPVRNGVAEWPRGEAPISLDSRKAGQPMKALLSVGKEAPEFRLRLDCSPVEVSIDLGEVSFLGFSSDLKGTIVTVSSPIQHPEAQKIQDLHEHWAIRVGLWREDQLASLRGLNLCWLWADCLADHPAEIAAILPDYCAMFIILDDTAERFIGEQGASAYKLLKQVFSIFYQILEGSFQTPSDVPAIRYPKYMETCTALVDLRERIRSHSTNRQYEWFLQGMDSYYRGVLQQVYLSGRKLKTSRETQIYNRELNVGFRPTVVLMAIISGLDLDDDVLEHPMFERVLMAICRLGGVINDIISFQKEVSADAWLGQYHNLIAAELSELSRNEKSGNLLEQAISRVFEFHNNEMNDFFLYGAAIIEDHPEFEEFHKLCAAMHRSWMDWCLKVERYSYAFSQDPVVTEIHSSRTRNARNLNEPAPQRSATKRIAATPGVVDGVRDVAGREP